MLLLLEDESERLARFTAVLLELAPNFPLKVWRDANVMIREVGPLLTPSSILSLDHDLDPDPGGGDPGDGYAVVKYLVSQPIIRPVVIHSSNHECARWMEGEFQLHGWDYWRVSPIGDDWIESDWRHVIRPLLKH